MFYVYEHHLDSDSIVIVEGRTRQAANNRAIDNGIDIVNRCEACGDTFWREYAFDNRGFDTVNEALLEVQPHKFEVIYIHQEQ